MHYECRIYTAVFDNFAVYSCGVACGDLFKYDKTSKSL